MTRDRIILLVVVVIAVIGGIWYLQKPASTTGPVATVSVSPNATAASEANQYQRAPELVDPTGFINTAPFTLSSLLGSHVILLDFWTYSCINCQRTIPYLNQWYAKYKDLGLVIVGVHSPEFDFEKNITNVQAAVKQLGIQYPVVLDSNMATWNAYQNQYWPAEYLIDANGYIIHTHDGEGDYATTEQAIQQALDALAQQEGKSATLANLPITTPSNAPQPDFTQIGTPESYLGSARNANAVGNGQTGVNGQQTFTIPTTTLANTVYLQGTWNITAQYAQCVSACGLQLQYSAKQVNIVAGASPAASVVVSKDGQSAGTVSVSGQTLYTLINDVSYGTHTLHLQIAPGVQMFTLTFG